MARILERIAVIERKIAVFPDFDAADPIGDTQYPGRIDRYRR